MSKRKNAKTGLIVVDGSAGTIDQRAPQLDLGIASHCMENAVPIDSTQSTSASEIEAETAPTPVILDPGFADSALLAVDAGREAHVESAESDDQEPVTVAGHSAGEIEIMPSLGQRLRAAREVRGLSREEMARRLRITPSVIQDIESDQWQRLGAAVYVRGHLNSYARSLDVPLVAVHHALQHLDEPAPLAFAVSAAPPDSWWSRYSSAATYMVLTLLLAIPVFTMMDKRGVNSPVPEVLVRSLDDSELTDAEPAPMASDSVVELVAPAESFGPPDTASASGIAAAAAPVQTSSPLMASMTPMGGLGSPTALPSGTHRVQLSFAEDSWLEVMDASNAKLEYGMARAGEQREHTVEGPVTMIIGNVTGARLLVDGENVDLSSFARLNVARLKLFDAEPTSSTSSR